MTIYDSISCISYVCIRRGVVNYIIIECLLSEPRCCPDFEFYFTVYRIPSSDPLNIYIKLLWFLFYHAAKLILCFSFFIFSFSYKNWLINCISILRVERQFTGHFFSTLYIIMEFNNYAVIGVLVASKLHKRSNVYENIWSYFFFKCIIYFQRFNLTIKTTFILRIITAALRLSFFPLYSYWILSTCSILIKFYLWYITISLLSLFH